MPWRHFPSCGFLFSDNSCLCQVNTSLSSTVGVVTKWQYSSSFFSVGSLHGTFSSSGRRLYVRPSSSHPSMWCFQEQRIILTLWEVPKGIENTLYGFGSLLDTSDRNSKNRFLVHCTRGFHWLPYSSCWEYFHL